MSNMDFSAGVITALIVAFLVGYLLRGVIAYVKSCHIWSKAEQAHYEMRGIDVVASHDKYRLVRALKAIEDISEKTSMENAIW